MRRVIDVWHPQALIDCFYILEDFDGLEALISRLPDLSPLLHQIGVHLQSVGDGSPVIRQVRRAMCGCGDVGVWGVWSVWGVWGCVVWVVCGGACACLVPYISSCTKNLPA